MNKVIIRDIGYDFEDEMISNLRRLEAAKRQNYIFVLPNYTLLQSMKERLAVEFGSIRTDNIITFDNIAKRYEDFSKKYIEAEEAAIIIKSIMDKMEDLSFLSTFETAMEIFEYIKNIKSSISEGEYEKKVSENEELKTVSAIFSEYQRFLKSYNLDDAVGKYKDAAENILKKPISKKFIISSFIEFRPEEYLIIENLIRSGAEIVIEYPFNMKRENIKIKKTIEKFKNLGFSVEYESDEKSKNREFSYYLYSNENFESDQKICEIKSRDKYYEVEEILNQIKKFGENTKFSDMSIIISDEYKEIVKNVFERENIPISIKNENRAIEIPIVKSVINLLELVKNDEKTQLITFLLDKNFSKDERDISHLIADLRQIDYRGLFYDYKFDDEEMKELLSYPAKIVENIKDSPIGGLEEFLNNMNFEERFVSSFEMHGDIETLNSSLKGLDVISKAIDEVKEFSRILNLKNDEKIDLLLFKLKNATYYARDTADGVIVLSAINAVGVRSKYRFIVGMNQNFPAIDVNGYFYGGKFSKINRKLGIEIETKYEKYDNEIIKFAEIVSGSENVIFSFVDEEFDKRETKSNLLVNLERFVKEKNIKKIIADMLITNDAKKNALRSGKFRLISDISNNRDKDFVNVNYISKRDADEINYLLDAHLKRKSNDRKFWGEIDKWRLKNIVDERISFYSPTMLDTYNKCHFKFFVKYILDIEHMEMEFKDEFSKDRGIFYHEVLQRLHSHYDVFEISCEDLKEKLRSTIDDVLGEKNIDEENIDLLKKLYFDYLLNFIEKDIELYNRRDKKFKPCECEKVYYKKVGNINIQGRIDRVDVSEDGQKIIVDYKTGNYPQVGDVIKLKELQLAIYALLVENTVGTYYASIKNADINAGFILDTVDSSQRYRKFSEDELKKFYEETLDLVRELDENIRAGNFYIKPLDKKFCTYCEYGDICRVEMRNDEEDEI